MKVFAGAATLSRFRTGRRGRVQQFQTVLRVMTDVMNYDEAVERLLDTELEDEIGDGWALLDWEVEPVGEA